MEFSWFFCEVGRSHDKLALKSPRLHSPKNGPGLFLSFETLYRTPRNWLSNTISTILTVTDCLQIAMCWLENYPSHPNHDDEDDDDGDDDGAHSSKTWRWCNNLGKEDLELFGGPQRTQIAEPAKRPQSSSPISRDLFLLGGRGLTIQRPSQKVTKKQKDPKSLQIFFVFFLVFSMFFLLFSPWCLSQEVSFVCFFPCVFSLWPPPKESPNIVFLIVFSFDWFLEADFWVQYRAYVPYIYVQIMIIFKLQMCVFYGYLQCFEGMTHYCF